MVATKKSPPIKNGTNGAPLTPSGRGVVNRGRQEARDNRSGRNSNGNGDNGNSTKSGYRLPPKGNNGTARRDTDRSGGASRVAAGQGRAAGSSKSLWSMTNGQARKLSDGLRQTADMLDTLWAGPGAGNLPAPSRVQDQDRDARRKAVAAKAAGAKTPIPGTTRQSTNGRSSASPFDETDTGRHGNGAPKAKAPASKTTRSR